MSLNPIQANLWTDSIPVALTLKTYRYWANTSKHWEENNVSRNCRFPFSLFWFPQDFLYVNNHLGEFDQFGPYPNIAHIKLSGPCDQANTSLCVAVSESVRHNWQTRPTALSQVLILIFSHTWIHIKKNPVFMSANQSHAEAEQENEDSNEVEDIFMNINMATWQIPIGYFVQTVR